MTSPLPLVGVVGSPVLHSLSARPNGSRLYLTDPVTGAPQIRIVNRTRAQSEVPEVDDDARRLLFG